MTMDHDDAESGGSPAPVLNLTAYKTMSLQELLARAHRAQIEDLLAKLEAGVISHQEHGVLARLLKDNGFTLPDSLRPGTIDGQACVCGRGRRGEHGGPK
jgi:hypothetical protein